MTLYLLVRVGTIIVRIPVRDTKAKFIIVDQNYYRHRHKTTNFNLHIYYKSSAQGGISLSMKIFLSMKLFEIVGMCRT